MMKIEIVTVPEGRYTGRIVDVVVKEVESSDGEALTRLMWTFESDAGQRVSGFTGLAATTKSNLYKFLLSMGSIGLSPKALVGRRVSFLVRPTQSGNSTVVDMPSTAPAV
jgi:hypothetical protein